MMKIRQKPQSCYKVFHDNISNLHNCLLFLFIIFIIIIPDSSPFRVTTTFQSPHINGNNVWPTVNNDQPVFISPWNTNSKESIFTTNLQKSSVHPFARRAKSRYLEPPPSSSDEQVGDDHRDDSFDEILKIANK